MPQKTDLEREIVDDVKFGAVAVINESLKETISAGTDPEDWSKEDKAKYFLILQVRDEILQRVRKTFLPRSRRK